MELRERLARGLTTARGLTEKLLEDIVTSEQWLTTAVTNGNHPLWIVGHLAVADDAFVGFVDRNATNRRAEYRKSFGKGSEPTSDLSQYDEPSTVLDYFRERRDALLATLSDVDADDFESALPEGAPTIMYDVASVFQMAAWHESLHTGQLTTIRRSLGFGPVV